MVAQGLRIYLSMQGVQVKSLLRELRFPHAWGPKTKTKNRNNVTNSCLSLSVSGKGTNAFPRSSVDLAASEDGVI